MANVQEEAAPAVVPANSHAFVNSLPVDAPDAVVLAARLADAERHIAALQVELATANERAESFRQLAAAKDEIITAARNQTKEWRKHASDVLAASAKTAAAAAAGGAAAKSSSSSDAGKDKKKK